MSLESDVTEQIEILEKNRDQLISEIKERQKCLESVQGKLYEEKMRKLHIEEAFRVARIKFPRLRGEKSGVLSIEDVAELEKWVKRAKTLEGLRDIVDAVRELQKYFQADVKTNLYALVQRIIIGGAIHSKRGKK